MSLELVKYLREEGIKDLEKKYFVKSVKHSEHPNLVLFKYNQIESDFSIPLVCEARGIILDENNDWLPVSYAFNRFFNYGETLSVPLDWDSVKCFDKVDGSIICLWRYNNQWNVSTKGTPDAETGVNGIVSDLTFKKLFWDTFSELGFELPDEEHFNYCFVFELTSPYNRVVVNHLKPSLTLLAARNLKTLHELPLEDLKGLESKYGWNLVKVYDDYSDIDIILRKAEEINPMENEGFVLCDKNFNRLKVKSSEYLKLHRCIDGMNFNGILRAVLEGEKSEVLVYFPQYKAEYEKIEQQVNFIFNEIDNTFQTVKDISDQKEFAQQVVKYDYSGILFNMRKNNRTAKQNYMEFIYSKHESIDMLKKLLVKRY